MNREKPEKKPVHVRLSLKRIAALNIEASRRGISVTELIGQYADRLAKRLEAS